MPGGGADVVAVLFSALASSSIPPAANPAPSPSLTFPPTRTDALLLARFAERLASDAPPRSEVLEANFDEDDLESVDRDAARDDFFDVPGLLVAGAVWGAAPSSGMGGSAGAGAGSSAILSSHTEWRRSVLNVLMSVNEHSKTPSITRFRAISIV